MKRDITFKASERVADRRRREAKGGVAAVFATGENQPKRSFGEPTKSAAAPCALGKCVVQLKQVDASLRLSWKTSVLSKVAKKLHNTVKMFTKLLQKSKKSATIIKV